MKLHKQTGLTVLWRGSLSSCNYGCNYCPFAKTSDSRESLSRDKNALLRFAEWAKSRPFNVSILFTPWGEGLVRGYYREIMKQLSHSGNIPTVAIQTNLSCSIDWVKDCDLSSIAFWITYHPGETPRASFLDKIHKLEDMGARYSVGIVGKLEYMDEIQALRKDLPEKSYLWVNAYRKPDNDMFEAGYYSAEQIETLNGIDPYFEFNTQNYPTRDRSCFAGENSISVLADGTARRCHFIEDAIGNIYDEDFEESLVARNCKAQHCSCHIGYSHLKDLDMKSLFGNGFIERRPDLMPEHQQVRAALKHYIREE